MALSFKDEIILAIADICGQSILFDNRWGGVSVPILPNDLLIIKVDNNNASAKIVVLESIRANSEALTSIGTRLSEIIPPYQISYEPVAGEFAFWNLSGRQIAEIVLVFKDVLKDYCSTGNKYQIGLFGNEGTDDLDDEDIAELWTYLDHSLAKQIPQE